MPDEVAHSVLEASLLVLQQIFPNASGKGIKQLTEPERRNALWRLELEGSGTPDSVIVKQRAPHLFDRAQPTAFGTRGFLDDWAGLEFVSEVFATEGLAPRFLGGNLQAGLFVLEDLDSEARDPGDSLVEPLLGDNVELATEGLKQMMRLLGHLHGGSVNHLDRYRELRQALDPNWDGAVSQSILAGLSYGVAQLREAFVITPEFDAEIGVLKERFTHPNALKVFGHADPCPDNWLFSDGALKLIDFEFSGLMSAGVDAGFARLPFPTCWCGGSLPVSLIEQLERTYRDEAGRHIPALLDNLVFERMMADATVAWTFNSFQWFERVEKEDQEWGINTVHARLLQRLDLLIMTPDIRTFYPAITATAHDLRTLLLEQWGNVVLKPYEAFT